MPGGSGADIFRSCPFTHAAHMSMSDVFSTTRNSQVGLDEGYHLGRECKSQDLMQQCAVEING